MAALALPALGSDNDQTPPYMIYINPETGKYTTEDPSAEPSAESFQGPAEAAVGLQTESPVTGAAVIAGLLLVVGLGLLLRRRVSANKGLSRS